MTLRLSSLLWFGAKLAFTAFQSFLTKSARNVLKFSQRVKLIDKRGSWRESNGSPVYFRFCQKRQVPSQPLTKDGELVRHSWRQRLARFSLQPSLPCAVLNFQLNRDEISEASTMFLFAHLNQDGSTLEKFVFSCHEIQTSEQPKINQSWYHTRLSADKIRRGWKFSFSWNWSL